MIYTNIDQAVKAYVKGFGRIPTALIDYAYGDKMEDVEFLTKPTPKQDICVVNGPYLDSEGYVLETLENKYLVELTDVVEDDFKKSGSLTMEISAEDIRPGGRDEYLSFPLWGTVWTFESSVDNNWLKDGDGLQVMSDLGFQIYYTDEIGYFFGLNAGGIDFYEAFWKPLYEARGINWHQVE